jgi:hypothetical protein
MCAEMVVGHALDLAALEHTLEADVAVSRRQRKTREPLSVQPHQFAQAFTFLEVLDWEVEGETRLDVVCVAMSVPFLAAAERSG